MLICTTAVCTCLYHPLLQCIETGMNAEAKILLEELGNPWDLTDDSGFTLIHYSVRYRNEVMVQYFIERGCNINARDNYQGFTPLMVAIANEDANISKILLNNNADVNITNHERVCSVQLAFHYFLCSKSFGNDKQGFLYPQRYDIHKQILLTFELVLEQLYRYLSLGTRPVKQKMWYLSDIAQLAAVAFGNLNLTKLLLDNDYSVDFHDPTYGYTALHYAVRFQKIENAKILVKYGANVCALDMNKNSPLHEFMHYCQYTDENSELLKILLRPNQLSAINNKPFISALCQYTVEYSELLKILLRPNQLSEIKKQPFIFADLLLNGSTEIVRVVLNTGKIDDEGAIFGYGKTYLHLIIENKKVHVYDLQYELANLHLDGLDSHDLTPLMNAVSRGFIDKVEVLLKLGADVSFISPNAGSALTRAVILAAGYRRSTFSLPGMKPETLYTQILEILLQHDSSIPFHFSYRQLYTIFYSSNDRLQKIIVAHFAMIEELRKSRFSDDMHTYIERRVEMNAYFKICTRQIEVMKNVTVNGMLSLFELLTGKLDKIVTYIRNQEFVSAFNNVMETTDPFVFYYTNTFQTRVSNAMYKIELDQKAAAAITKLTGLCSDVYYYIVYKIVSYLNLKDLHVLAKV